MINVERIRNQVQKAIDALPAPIDLKRTEGVDDGYGGYTLGEEINVASFNCFIDFSSNKPSVSISLNDSGNIFSVKNIVLLAAYDPLFDIKKDDYFTYKGIAYKIRHPINQFDIYWECEIEVIE